MPVQSTVATGRLPRTVADLMRRKVVTVSPSATVRELVDLLRTEGISGVPVVDQDGKVVGTVSSSDLMWLSDWLAGEEDDSGEGRARTAQQLAVKHVSDVMTPDVFGVAPDASVEELARFFARTGVGRAVVLERDKLVGIVSVIDLFALIADQAGQHGR